MRKPDLYLRWQPLIEVLQAIPLLRDMILFHPVPLHHKTTRDLCFCGQKHHSQMVACDVCGSWYHYNCVKLTRGKLLYIDAWKCGYCLGSATDGGTKWNQQSVPAAMPGQKKKKKPQPLPLRPKNFTTPNEKSRKRKRVAEEWTGPSTWLELRKEIVAHNKALGKLLKTEKKRAGKLIDKGEHHVSDCTSGGLLYKLSPANPHAVDYVLGLADHG